MHLCGLLSVSSKKHRVKGAILRVVMSGARAQEWEDTMVATLTALEPEAPMHHYTGMVIVDTMCSMRN